MASPAMRSGASPFSKPAGEQPEASNSPANPSARRPMDPRTWGEEEVAG